MKKLEELGISPTPWEIGRCSNGWNIVLDAKGKYAATPDGDEETEAISNARLIKAAPRLYECLKEAVEDKCHFCVADEDERRELCDQCIVADWKDALAEASGESEVK